MTFDELLRQAFDMLQRWGGVSNRALKAHLELDNALLKLLKDEIIEVHQPAQDQDRTMLIWTGDPDAAPTTTTESATPEAERRQLTVMFCDLVNSTRLSGQLNPEYFRDIVRTYHQTCTEIIERFDGYLTQLVGDGLRIDVGYPHAHEDDAYRAAHEGLAILEALLAFHDRLQLPQAIRIAVRIGIHTGLAVVEDIRSTLCVALTSMPTSRRSAFGGRLNTEGIGTR